MHQALQRLPPAVGRRQEVLRAVFHGAMALYLARYLNVPPARLPGEDGEEGLDHLPTQATALQSALLDSFDRRHQVELAARLVARHLRLGHPPDLLITTLAAAVLREDAGFHAYQMLEAGVRQFYEWGDTDEGRHVLIAVARYISRRTSRPNVLPTRPPKSPASCCAAVSCTRVPTPDREGWSVFDRKPEGHGHGLLPFHRTGVSAEHRPRGAAAGYGGGQDREISRLAGRVKIPQLRDFLPALVEAAAGVSSKRGTMMSDENLERRIAARLGELVNWTRRIFWLLLIVLVIEVILMAFLLLRYLAA